MMRPKLAVGVLASVRAEGGRVANRVRAALALGSVAAVAAVTLRACQVFCVRVVVIGRG